MRNRKLDLNGFDGFDTAYLSDISPKDKTWDGHRANVDLVRDSYDFLGNKKYSLRLNKCSQVLEFALKQESDKETLFTLTDSRFCRIRYCPVCQWRKAMMWRARFYKAIPKIREAYPKHQFIFLTLTVENCPVRELRQTIDWMNKAWLKLVKRKQFPGIGWVKVLEITKSEINEAHPHFHCILIVPNYYFTSRDYVTHEEWIKLWKQSLKVDYNPSISIKKVSLKKKRQAELTKELNRELTDDEIVFYGLIECLKYSVKEGDLISNPYWLEVITKQLHKIRAIALGGIFKEYLSEEDAKDDSELIHTGLQESDLSPTDAKFLFGWKEKLKRYKSI